MQRPNEVNRSGFRESELGGHSVHVRLQTDVRCGFDLQAPPFLVVVEITDKARAISLGSVSWAR